MSLLELPMNHVPALLPVAVLLALSALAISVAGLRKIAGERRRLESMQRDLEVFTEASTRVADALDQLLRGDVTPPAESSAPSRRYLLQQARRGVQNGESVDTLTARLGLCEDERRLLEFLRMAAPQAERAQPL